MYEASQTADVRTLDPTSKWNIWQQGPRVCSCTANCMENLGSWIILCSLLPYQFLHLLGLFHHKACFSNVCKCLQSMFFKGNSGARDGNLTRQFHGGQRLIFFAYGVVSPLSRRVSLPGFTMVLLVFLLLYATLSMLNFNCAFLLLIVAKDANSLRTATLLGKVTGSSRVNSCCCQCQWDNTLEE